VSGRRERTLSLQNIDDVDGIYLLKLTQDVCSKKVQAL